MKSRIAVLVAILIALYGDLSYASPTCKDIDTFRWRNKNAKTCEWISQQSDRKKNRICNNKRNPAARQNCQVTCNSCGETVTAIQLRSSCPRKPNSKRYLTRRGSLKSCNQFQPGLKCSTHSWTGCNTGDMACTSTSTYTCDEESLRWTTSKNTELCEPTVEDKPYGESCIPKECPPFKPIEGGDCSWYTGSETCLYDYQVTGCESGATSCTPTTEATCNSETNIWVFAPIYSLCGTGESCDISTYFDCPIEEPAPGGACKVYNGPQDCKYGHQIMGCTAQDLFCGYSSLGFCDPAEATWKSFATIPPICDSTETELTMPISLRGTTTTVDDPLPIGETCDPSACPPSEPKDRSYCGAWEGIKGQQECFYQYKMKGCSSDNLSCQPDVSYTCQIDTNEWIKEGIYDIKCIAHDPLWGTDCDPTEEPAPKKEDKEIVTEEEAPVPEKEQQPIVTEEEAPVPEKEQEPIVTEEEAPRTNLCPLDPPEGGTSCTKSDITEGDGCPYSYMVTGCTPETLACSPLSIFYCDSSVESTWIVMMSSVEFCMDAPKDWPDGNSCDPATFDPSPWLDNGTTEDLAASCPIKQPVVGSDCTKSPPEGCAYKYTVVGCTPETLECLPVSTFVCDPNDRMWIEQIDARVKCAIPEGYPTGECDPENFEAVFSERQDGICPSTQPIGGTNCGKTGSIEGGCPYSYQVFGCSLEEAGCLASNVLFCEYDDAQQMWLWQHMVADVAPCTDNYTPPGTCESGTFVPDVEEGEEKKPGNGICPPKQPTRGEDCSRTGPIDEGCPYDYIVVGCSIEEANCLPISTFYCHYNDEDDAWLWELAMMRRELIILPCDDNYTPPGTCQGDVFVPIRSKPKRHLPFHKTHSKDGLFQNGPH